MGLFKRFGVAIIVFLVFLILILAGVFLFFAEPTADEEGNLSDDAELPKSSLGLGNIGVDEIEPLPIGDDFASGRSDGVDVGDKRDDRVHTPFVSEKKGEVVETQENIPPLVRLFRGPTAGYRIDLNKDGEWEVKIVEQGRGHRYLAKTVPYSLALISRGEFTLVMDAHLFANDQVLILHESVDDESVVRSSFVPFSTSTTGSRVQWFEDNIRVATNNENMLFFTRVVNDESVGVVVDVSDPQNTRVVWRSGFRTWIPRWGRNPHITLRTPATEHMKGLVYLVDPEGALPDDQFVSLSSGGSALIDAKTGYFFLFETSKNNFAGKASITNRSRDISLPLPITIPEKCDGFNGVFVCAVPTLIPTLTLSGYDTVFPDSWYQGDIQFEDVVILVNALTGEKKLLMSSGDDEIKILSDDSVFDIINPRISEDGRFFFFVNRYDMSLWMLRLF